MVISTNDLNKEVRFLLLVEFHCSNTRRYRLIFMHLFRSILSRLRAVRELYEATFNRIFYLQKRAVRAITNSDQITERILLLYLGN